MLRGKLWGGLLPNALQVTKRNPVNTVLSSLPRKLATTISASRAANVAKLKIY